MNGSDALLVQAQTALAAAKTSPKTAPAADFAKARQTAENFEAFFLGQMLQPMFAGIETEEPFGGGAAEEMWRSLLVDEYGKAIAKRGGIGISDAVMAQMLKLQEINRP